MTKKEIVERYERAQTAAMPDGSRLLLISINKTVEDSTLGIYNAVRYSWKVSPKKAGKADLVLAVAFGLIVGVFVIDGEWLEATEENFPDIPDYHGNWEHQSGRYGFRGRGAPESVSGRYLYKRVPSEFTPHGNPIRFVG
jgi:hypothetical protein